MAGESHTTTDHDEIRHWIEERGGEPATVTDTSKGAEKAGVLRVMFPDYKESEADDLRRIDWREFFDKFEHENLAFLYQDETTDRDTSRFFKFVQR